MRSRIALAACLCVWGCTAEQNIHETKQAQSQPCINCHSAAYVQVKTPPHEGIKPVTCNDCHGTTAWVPTIGLAGHPEESFPIAAANSKHHNPAIGCNDCHDKTRGQSSGGMNTDCIHCHIGAHTIPAIDAVHATLMVANYPPANEMNPNGCLDCHPAGKR